MRIAILTGGGDCPGLNAVIRAVVKTAQNEHGWEVLGVRNGFEGFLAPRRRGHLPRRRARRRGDAPARRHDPRREQPAATSSPCGATRTAARRVARASRRRSKRLGARALIVVGGEGTQKAALALSRHGRARRRRAEDDRQRPRRHRRARSASTPPSHVVAEAIDRLHTTAESHHRVMCVEVMGRHAGWIALHGGIAGGADVILIPEIPYDPARVAAQASQSRVRHGRTF